MDPHVLLGYGLNWFSLMVEVTNEITGKKDGPSDVTEMEPEDAIPHIMGLQSGLGARYSGNRL